MNRILSKIEVFVRDMPIIYALAMFLLIRRKWEGRTLVERIRLARKVYNQRKAGLPGAIACQVVSVCTLDCDFCIIRDIKLHKYRRKTRMSLEEFKKIIDDISWFTTDMQFSGGEPFINPDIFDMLAYARQKGIYTLVASNISLLDKGDNLSKLIENPPDRFLLSYEGLDKETYEGIRRRGDFDKMVDNIKKLVAAKKRSGNKYPIITLQMVLTKKNMHQEDSFWESVKELGADYGSVKALGVWPEGSEEYEERMIREYIVPRSEHAISRHEIDENGKLVCYRKPGQCPAVNFCSIGSGGEIIPCWYIVARTEMMGNAIDENFVDVWNSEKYREYRHKMLHDWANPLCHKCIGVGATGKKRRL